MITHISGALLASTESYIDRLIDIGKRPVSAVFDSDYFDQKCGEFEEAFITQYYICGI